LAKTVTIQASALLAVGRPGEADGICAEAAPLTRTATNRSDRLQAERADILLLRGRAKKTLGRPDQARAHVEDAIALYAVIAHTRPSSPAAAERLTTARQFLAALA
jgi:hypothetical protein